MEAQGGVETVLEVGHSIAQSTGESDLEVTFRCGNGEIWRALIENKIDASLQPAQVERYKERGETYVARGDCVGFRRLLVAPAEYQSHEKSLANFDRHVTYEALRDWYVAAEALGARRHVKAGLLEAAIQKAAQGYQLEEDTAVSDFWQRYWEVAQELASELQMKEPSAKGGKSGFVYFRPLTLAKGLSIVHKLPHGNVDLQFRGMGEKIALLQEHFGPHLREDMELARAGKSASIRVKVPVLNTGAAFVGQEDAARAGLLAAKDLLAWSLAHPAP